MTSLTATENLNNNPTVSKSGGAGAATTTVVCAREAAPVPKASVENGQEPSDIILTQQFVDYKANKVPNDIRVTAVPDVQKVKEKESAASQQLVDVRKILARRASSPFQNGRTELLIGTEDNKLKTTAVVESNNNKLKIDQDIRLVPTLLLD